MATERYDHDRPAAHYATCDHCGRKAPYHQQGVCMECHELAFMDDARRVHREHEALAKRGRDDIGLIGEAWMEFQEPLG